MIQYITVGVIWRSVKVILTRTSFPSLDYLNDQGELSIKNLGIEFKNLISRHRNRNLSKPPGNYSRLHTPSHTHTLAYSHTHILTHSHTHTLTHPHIITNRTSNWSYRTIPSNLTHIYIKRSHAHINIKTSYTPYYIVPVPYQEQPIPTSFSDHLLPVLPPNTMFTMFSGKLKLNL